MKTIYTTLPIYDKVIKQNFERGRGGITAAIPVPIVCPLHRLPSFQWKDDGDGAMSVTKVELITLNNSVTDITALFTLPDMIPVNTGYFTYSGTTLLSNMDEGIYYLRITMDNAKTYYSDWINVSCVYADDGLPPIATYSTKYLIIDFTNSCPVGSIYYFSGFTQTIWIESDVMEPSYVFEEKGVENGESRFVRTFARQTKKYTLKTKIIPAFMVDVFHRLKMHESITLTDLVGDINTIYNLEVEHEWIDNDKYYATAILTFDYDESVVIGGCCGG